MTVKSRRASPWRARQLDAERFRLSPLGRTDRERGLALAMTCLLTGPTSPARCLRRSLDELTGETSADRVRRIHAAYLRRTRYRPASPANSLRRVIGPDLLLRAGTQERNQNVPGIRGRRRSQLRKKASIGCGASAAFLLPSVHDSQAADGRHVDRRRCSEHSEVAQDAAANFK